jgi:cadmium resistance protein CadD (predicted permease)
MDGEYIGFAAVLLIFGVIPVTAGIVYIKLRARQMETLVKLSEQGAALDADTIRLMSGASTSYKTDYKWGLLWLALGIPVCLGLFVDDGLADAVWGLIPVSIGIAFMIAGKMRLRETG